jgi:CRP-like cAMP-binding protein
MHKRAHVISNSSRWVDSLVLRSRSPGAPMQSAYDINSHPLIRKLESIFDLTGEERQAVLGLRMTVRELRADQDIVRDQDRPSQCCLVLKGSAYRYKVFEGGRRQIFSFHLAGDIPDLQSIHLRVMDHSLATLETSTLGFVTHDDLRPFIRAWPRIGDALWRDTLIDAAIFRLWMAGIGRKEAFGRIAHLLCELFVRSKAVGLTEGAAFLMPITQVEVADALGLSSVHVNRTLQDLRAAGLISTHRRSVTIENWIGLQEAAEFDPTYLHLKVDAL